MAAMVTLAAAPARAVGEPPLLVGPVIADGSGAVVESAAVSATFEPDAGAARIVWEVRLAVPNGGTARLGFAGRALSSPAAWVDGRPVEPARAESPLPAAGGPFERQLVIVAPSGALVRFEIRLASVEEDRGPRLRPSQAGFGRNRFRDRALARVVDLDPAAAAGRLTRVVVETPTGFRPAAPVAGEPAETPGGGRVLAGAPRDPAAPLRLEAVAGDHSPPETLAFGFSVGIALDWAHLERTRTATAGGVEYLAERWYETPGIGDALRRAWVGLYVQLAYDTWQFATGLEADPVGVLEIPFLFRWFPREPAADDPTVRADWWLLGGLTCQIFNDAAPVDYALDLRPFLRVGAGFRLLLFAGEIAYEVAPPMGDWNGPRGLVEHKLLFSFPFAV